MPAFDFSGYSTKNYTSPSTNRREEYRTSNAYKTSVTSKEKISTSKKSFNDGVGKSNLDNLKVSKIPAFIPGSTILNAGLKFRQKTLDKNVEYFKGLKRRNPNLSYDLTDTGYKSYMKDRLAGKIDASGNLNSGYGRDRDNNIRTKKVTAGGQTILTTTPTTAEVSQAKAAQVEDSIELKKRRVKAKGRSPTIMTGVTGATGGLTLGKPSLLGM